MSYKENRKMKVYEATVTRNSDSYFYRTKYVPVPQIKLQGNWLQELGFEPGKNLNVNCKDGQLTITLAE